MAVSGRVGARVMRERWVVQWHGAARTWDATVWSAGVWFDGVVWVRWLVGAGAARKGLGALCVVTSLVVRGRKML